ncbi:MAG: tRNA (adenosine(37)-N6)-threonylcarbamoyltransferase complex ATPase subunit type 1 TsaE [Acidobacteria bacterium]|nr:tRNA (adenosine(37)-N6)-threonylcarbamoyltransferase complex ATPase subunit type 1 TsaE [Acidobacteriota bacterium]
MTTLEVTTSSPEETQAFGRRLADQLKPPALVLLYGELGAGKTTLIKGIVSGLGLAPAEEVTSPSFVFVHVFGDRLRLYHVDLYRIEEPAELETLGLDELLAEQAIVLVEWAERLSWSTPALALRVHLEALSDEERRIRVEGG